MRVIRLKFADTNSLRAVNHLLSQLSSRAQPMSRHDFRKMMEDEDVLLFVLRNVQEVVGMGTLVFIRTTTGCRARIEDVVIDEKYRGRGWGDKLTRRLISQARQKRTSYIELTSRPSRVAANRLYMKLGFKRHRTNTYRLVI